MKRFNLIILIAVMFAGCSDDDEENFVEMSEPNFAIQMRGAYSYNVVITNLLDRSITTTSNGLLNIISISPNLVQMKLEDDSAVYDLNSITPYEIGTFFNVESNVTTDIDGNEFTVTGVVGWDENGRSGYWYDFDYYHAKYSIQSKQILFTIETDYVNDALDEQNVRIEFTADQL